MAHKPPHGVRPIRPRGSPVTAEPTLDLHTDYVWIVTRAEGGYTWDELPGRFYERAFPSESDAEKYADEFRAQGMTPYVHRVIVKRLGDVPTLEKVWTYEMREDEDEPRIDDYETLRGRVDYAASDSRPHVKWDGGFYVGDSLVTAYVTVRDVNRERAASVCVREVREWREE